MDITAHNDFVILERLEAPEKIGNLVLPEANRELCRQRPIGRVLSVGPKVNDEITSEPVEEGQIFLFDDRAAACCHGLDGDLRTWVRAEFLVGRLVSDQHATADKIAKDRARKQKIDAEREAQGNLVRANGHVPHLAQ